MQILKICSALLLLAVVTIEAAEIRDNGRYQVFKRNPLVGKHEEDVRESGRMHEEIMGKMWSMFSKKSKPMMMVMMPSDSSLLPPIDGEDDVSDLVDDITDAATDATDDVTDAATDAVDTAADAVRFQDRFSFLDDLDSDDLEDDDQLIFEVEDGNEKNGSLNDDDDSDNENENDDGQVQYQSNNDYDDSEDEQNSNKDSAVAVSDSQVSKHKDCGQSDDSDAAPLGRASKRQDEIKRKKEMKRIKKLKRQLKIKRQQEIEREREMKRRSEIRRRNRIKQQKIRKLKKLKRKINRRRRLQWLRQQQQQQQQNRVVLYRIN